MTRSLLLSSYAGSLTERAAGSCAWSVQHQQPHVAPLHRYDYGSKCEGLPGHPERCNQQAYRSPQPPAYNLARIRTPLALFSGTLACSNHHTFYLCSE